MPTEPQTSISVRDPGKCYSQGQRLIASGPLVLPSHKCVKCGSSEPGGEVRNDIVSYVNPLIWLTFIISGLITIVAYYTTRKKLQVRYYLCPSCADTRRIGEVTSTLVLVSAVVGMTLTALGGPFHIFLAAFFIGLFGRVFLVRKPLRAVAHDTGTFSLKGASPDLLRTLPSPEKP